MEIKLRRKELKQRVEVWIDAYFVGHASNETYTVDFDKHGIIDVVGWNYFEEYFGSIEYRKLIYNRLPSPDEDERFTTPWGRKAKEDWERFTKLDAMFSKIYKKMAKDDTERSYKINENMVANSRWLGREIWM